MNDYEHELATRLHEANCRVAHAAEAVQHELQRPFMLLRPRMFPDGNQWCALYGEDLQSGVCAFGDTPAKAATQFDSEWLNAAAGPASRSTDLLTSVMGDLPKFPGVRR